MKKVLLKCTALILVLCIFTGITAFARESGTFGGTSISWVLDADGVLTISGIGGIPDVAWETSKEDIKNVIIEKGITRICDSAFEGCINLTVVELPDSITTIGNDAFRNCSALNSITLHKGLTTIKASAFSGCSALENIELPDSVSEIYAAAFSLCESLEEIVIPDGVTQLSGTLFSGCTNLRRVKLPENITTISAGCFTSCESLEEINIPDTVTLIEQNAFKGCSALNEIIFPENLKEIGFSAFAGCSSLKKIALPESLATIGHNAFGNCTSLETVKIPQGIDVIEDALFSGCINLNECILPNTVTQIGAEVFCNCESLESIVLPTGVKKIPYKTFYNCLSLSSITMPSGVISINKNAFKGCDNVETVFFAGTQSEWEKIDFLSGNEILSDAEVVCDVPGIKGVKIAPINNGNVSLEVELSGYDYGGKLFGVMYDDNYIEKVVSVKPENKPIISFDGAEYGKGYKIFWWEDISGMNPVINGIEGKIEKHEPKLEYAYLTDINETKNGIAMTIFTVDAEFINVDMAPEVRIDEETYSATDYEVISYLMYTANSNYIDAENSVYHQPIMYQTNYSGEVDEIHTVLSTTNSDISSVMNFDEIYFAPCERRVYKASAKTFTDFKVSSSTKIIFVPDDRTSYDDYKLFSYSDAFINGRYYDVEAYGITGPGTASLVLMYHQNDNMIYTSKSPWMIVQSVAEDDDENTVVGYEGISYEEKRVVISEEVEKPASDIESGDVIRYLVDKNGEMVDYQIWYDMSNPCQLNPVRTNNDLYDDGNPDTEGANRIIEIHATSTTPKVNYPNATFRLQYGTIEEIVLNSAGDTTSNGHITVSGIITEDNLEIDYFGKESSTVSKEITDSVEVFGFDKTSGVVTNADLSKVADYNSYKEDATRVIIYTQSGVLKTIYIVDSGYKNPDMIPEPEEIEEKGEYAYLCSIEPSIEESYNMEFRFLDTSGNFYQISVAKLLEIDGKLYDTSEADILEALKKSAETANENYQGAQNFLYHQPILYVKENGAITKLYTVLSEENGSISTMMNTDERTHFVPAEERTYKSSAKTFTDFKVSSTTKIIFIPDDRTDYDSYLSFSDYSKAFTNGRQYIVEGYGLTSTHTASLVIIYSQNDSKLYTSSSPWMIVQSKGDTPEGVCIRGYTGTSYSLISVCVNEEDCPSIASIGKGDVIRYLTDQWGKMADYQIWFDMSNPCQLQSVNTNDALYDDGNPKTAGANRIIEIHSTSTLPIKNYPAATFRLQYGTVTDIVLKNGNVNTIDEEYITISPVLAEDGLDMDYFEKESSNNISTISETIGSSVKVFSFNRKDSNGSVVAEAALSDIHSYAKYGDDASRVIVYTAGGNIRMIYIVKE